MKSPLYGSGDILYANGEFAVIIQNDCEIETDCMFVGAYKLQFSHPDGKTETLTIQHTVVDRFFKLAKAYDNCKMLPIDGWNKTAAIPMQIGWVIKRWNKPTGPVLWAGYFNGSAKMASCDEWMPLTIEEKS